MLGLGGRGWLGHRMTLRVNRHAAARDHRSSTISADSAVAFPVRANAGPASGRAPVAAACSAASRLAPESHYFRLTVTAEPVDQPAADQAAHIALAAARAGVFRTAPAAAR